MPDDRRRHCLHKPCPACGAAPFTYGKLPDPEKSKRIGRKVLKACPSCVPEKWGAECGCVPGSGFGTSTPEARK